MNVLITQVYEKLAMVRAANQSLRIERDIMLRHPGEKMYSTYFLKG